TREHGDRVGLGRERAALRLRAHVRSRAGSRKASVRLQRPVQRPHEDRAVRPHLDDGGLVGRRALIVVALAASPAAAEPPRWDFGWGASGGGEGMGERMVEQMGVGAWLRYRGADDLALVCRGELLRI